MPVVKLIPSHYSRSSTHIVVTDAANMYNDVSHTANYASLRGRAGTSSNSTYYLYLNGFDFSSIPANAVINSFTIRIRCSRNTFQSSASSERLRLASNTSNTNVIANTTASVNIGTSASVITIPTGDLQWSDIIGFSNFSIQIRLRNTSTSSSDYPYIYVYGAEIEVDYSIVDSYYYMLFLEDE